MQEPTSLNPGNKKWKKFEPWFDRYECVVVLKSPKDPTGELKLKHKTCGRLVSVPKDWIPPRICPICGVNVVLEHKSYEEYKDAGAVELVKEAPRVRIQPLFPNLHLNPDPEAET